VGWAAVGGYYDRGIIFQLTHGVFQRGTKGMRLKIKNLEKEGNLC
jgi:hypothetical protein